MTLMRFRLIAGLRLDGSARDAVIASERRAMVVEHSSAAALAWIAGGEVPALAKATNLRYVDIDSGHWPRFTQPAKLAEIFAQP